MDSEVKDAGDFLLKTRQRGEPPHLNFAPLLLWEAPVHIQQQLQLIDVVLGLSATDRNHNESVLWTTDHQMLIASRPQDPTRLYRTPRRQLQLTAKAGISETSPVANI